MNTVNTDLMQRHEMDFIMKSPMMMIISVEFSHGQQVRGQKVKLCPCDLQTHLREEDATATLF